jgi:hypothetical protein
MRMLVLAILSMAATGPVEAHCHRTWHYPWPDPDCRQGARQEARHVRPGHTYYVEITRMPDLGDLTPTQRWQEEEKGNR